MVEKSRQAPGQDGRDGQRLSEKAQPMDLTAPAASQGLNPHIDSYTFSSMTVDGTEYTSDLIIFPDKVSPNWWRKEGHSLCVEDLGAVLDNQPDTLIVGTGAYSMVKIPDATRTALTEAGIELVVAKTGAAVGIYNELAKKGKRVVGAFHLTC